MLYDVYVMDQGDGINFKHSKKKLTIAIGKSQDLVNDELSKAVFIVWCKRNEDPKVKVLKGEVGNIKQWLDENAEGWSQD